MDILPLKPEKYIEKEQILGFYTLPLDNPPPAIDILTVKSLFQNTHVMAPILSHEPVPLPSYARQVNKELGELFGGVFQEDLSPYIQCYPSLVPESEKTRYQAGGMQINWDVPQESFYSIQLSLDTCHLQALGELGNFHCLSFAYLLDETELFDKDRNPTYPDINFIKSHFATYAPQVSLETLQEVSDRYAPNVYNFYFENENLVVKGGIRQKIEASPSQTPENKKDTFFYGIRINWKM